MTFDEFFHQKVNQIDGFLEEDDNGFNVQIPESPELMIISGNLNPYEKQIVRLIWVLQQTEVADIEITANILYSIAKENGWNRESNGLLDHVLSELLDPDWPDHVRSFARDCRKEIEKLRWLFENTAVYSKNSVIISELTDFDFWNDTVNTIEVKVSPFKLDAGSIELALMADDNSTNMYLSYKIGLSLVDPKYRAIAGLLAAVYDNSPSIKDTYARLVLAIAVSKGTITPQISRVTCENSIHKKILTQDAHEQVLKIVGGGETALSEAQSVINDVLAGKHGADKVSVLEGIIGGKVSLETNPKPQEKNSSEGFILGSLVNSGDNFIYDGERSIFTVAPPGSGKTQCHVLPNLNSFKGSAIVLDIKGECFLNSYQWRHENVGSVMVFSPSKPDQSQRYNPLSFVSQDFDQVWEDSRLLAEMLVIPHSQNDPTWETQGRQLLTVLIAYTAYLPHEKRNMATILDLISEIGLEDALSNLAADGTTFPSAMRRTANKFLQMRKTSEKQFQGVLLGASQHLTIWEGHAVETVTSASDWSPEDFRKKTPMTLYLHVPPNAIETYAPLMRVIIAQHVRHLMREEPDQNAPKILFMLDELPRLGKMEPIREALEVGRSYGIKLWMFAQYLGQLQKAYGKEIADGMIESCGVRVYMNPGADIAEKLSNILGSRENLLTGKTEPVVTPQELMGPEWRDDMLVLATGEKPLRLKKAFFHEQA